jgi:U3 small nucleolar RNA-associated protein 18
VRDTSRIFHFHSIHIGFYDRSKTGLVNVYGSDSTMAGTSGAPKPLKTIGNITTAISTMCFNRDAQILALSSKNKKDQLKMV